MIVATTQTKKTALPLTVATIDGSVHLATAFNQANIAMALGIVLITQMRVNVPRGSPMVNIVQIVHLHAAITYVFDLTINVTVITIAGIIVTKQLAFVPASIVLKRMNDSGAGVAHAFI